MDIKGMPRMRGIAGAQVNKNSGYWWSSALVCFCFALLGLLFSCRTGGSDVTKIHISPQQYENEFLTEPFEIKSGGICKIFFHAPVDNSWVYMNAALVNEKDEAIADFSGNMSYYHGYDDGNWTEGSQDDSLYLKLEKGKYRLLLLGQAGKGEREQGIQHGKKVTIRIKEGVMVRYYFVIFAVLAIILMLYFIVRIAIFQTRKWQHAQDDD